MHETEVSTDFYPFPEARLEGESPARLHMTFEKHVNTGTVLEMADLLIYDAQEIFRKDERNVMWIENFKDGQHLQALFDLSLRKTGTILRSIAFMQFALGKNKDYASRPMTEEEQKLLMDLPFGDFSFDYVNRGVTSAATYARDYQTALLLAAGKLEHQGYPVEVVYEDSLEAAPLDEEDMSFENFKVEATNEVVRETKILAQWKRIAESATPESPVNVCIHIGSAHNTMAEEASKLGDSFSVMLDQDTYPDTYKAPWDKLKRGFEVTEEEYKTALAAERKMEEGSPLYIPSSSMIDLLAGF